MATDEGFLVVLPYCADWVSNVVAAGTARLDADGTRYVVTVSHAVRSPFATAPFYSVAIPQMAVFTGQKMDCCHIRRSIVTVVKPA